MIPYIENIIYRYTQIQYTIDDFSLEAKHSSRPMLFFV